MYTPPGNDILGLNPIISHKLDLTQSRNGHSPEFIECSRRRQDSGDSVKIFFILWSSIRASISFDICSFESIVAND